MASIRRNLDEPRIELVPLIDVIFMLLTFFVLTHVMMIPARVVPMQTPVLRAGSEGSAVPSAVTISIDGAGSLYLDRQRVAADDLIEQLAAARAADPDLVIYVAAADQGEPGAPDRLPLFLALYDRLAQAGLDITLVGRPPAGDDDP